MIKAIETFYKDECYKRLKVPIENNERLGNKIERFIKDWAKFNKREKVTVLKNNVISEFDIESTSNINQIKEEMVNFKGKSLDIQKKINGLLETIGKNDKFNDLDKIYSEMNENYLNIMKDIGDLKYDKLTIQKIQDIKNKNAEMDYNFKELLNDKMYNINNNVNMNMNNGINNQQQPYLQPQHPQMPSQNLPQFNQNNQEPFAQSVNIVNQEYSKRMSENFNLFNNEKNSQMMNSLNNSQNSFNNNFNNNNFNNNNNNMNNNMNKNMNNNMNNNINNNMNNNINNNMNNNINNNMNNNMNNNFNNNNMNNNFNNNGNNNINNNMNNSIYNNNIPQQNLLDEQIQRENQSQFTYELIIYLKEKSDDILIYNEKYGLTKTKIDPSSDLKIFPVKSKFVNLGTSALLVGGEKQEGNYKEKIKKCYLITLIENESSKIYEVNVMPYADLIEARERHNLIFLPDKNWVFACSGFYITSCEYTNIYEGKWQSISSLNKSRGNASMAYVNDQYIFVIGGFSIKQNNKGVYLDDIEYFDINNMKKGWTIINYINNKGYNMALTALGVVPISKSMFLICGGYDGKEYIRNVYKVDCKNLEHPIVEETQSLGEPTIFMHNLFCKIRKSYFNFGMNGEMYGFDYENWRFGMLNFNQNK